MEELSTGIGPAAKIALKHAAAEDDASMWCARLARFGMIEEAERHFRPAAEDGDLAAIKCMVWLAWEAGRDAQPWLERAVEAGDPWAMYELGASLPQHPKGRQEKERWYRRAAEAGHALAMNDLAALLSRAGLREEAMRWYQRAAEAGVEIAMNNLAVQYVLQARPQRPSNGSERPST
ncbi:tetratricopeptide repeat protein [Spirillospora sp. NPDC048911]|uniref:tetratricopeptide repeat protein n=1 Tax=Spirillospora sp. NPDC048911 TaxID=3364527 RepID=UPI003713B021